MSAKTPPKSLGSRVRSYVGRARGPFTLAMVKDAVGAENHQSVQHHLESLSAEGKLAKIRRGVYRRGR